MDTIVTLTANQEAALTEIIALTQNVSISQIVITTATQTSVGLKVESITTILLIGYFANYDVTSITTYISTNQNTAVNNQTIFNEIITQVQNTYQDSSLNSVTGATVTQPVATIIGPPTMNPTFTPTFIPTSTPTMTPTSTPTFSPTFSPTNSPTNSTSAYSTQINLGSCLGFALMSGTEISFDGVLSTVALGSIGVSPGTSITGNYVIQDGTIEVNTSPAVNCAADELTAFNIAKGTTCTNANTPTDLGGLTLTPGVYCNSAGYFEINGGALTLDALGDKDAVFLFQAATTVITQTSTSIVLTRSAKAANVFWQVGTGLTMGTTSSFVGTILAGTGITIGSGATLLGRGLAQTFVTCANANTVTNVYASPPTFSPSSHPTFYPTTVPTSFAPTIAPTVQTVPIVTVSNSMTLAGYGTSSSKSLFRLMDTIITLTANQEAALTQIIALIQNVSISQIVITTATQTTVGLKVDSMTTILLIGYFANFDVTTITTFIATNQNNAISDPTIFNAIITQVQDTYQDPSLSSVSGATVTQPVATIVEPSSSDKKKSKNLSGGDIAAAVILSIFGALLIIGGILYYFYHFVGTDVTQNNTYGTDPVKETEHKPVQDLELADVGTASI